MKKKEQLRKVAVVTRKKAKEKSKRDKEEKERMSTSDQMKHLMMVQFSGKKEDYPVFASKFKALCAMKGCLEALEPSFMAQLPADDSTVLDESKEAEAKQIEAKKKNMTAMSYLTFTMSTPQLLAKIEASNSMAWWFSV